MPKETKRGQHKPHKKRSIHWCSEDRQVSYEVFDAATVAKLAKNASDAAILIAARAELVLFDEITGGEVYFVEQPAE